MKKTVSAALVFSVLISCIAFLTPSGSAGQEESPPRAEIQPAALNAPNDKPATELYLHIGSPIALSGGMIMPVDSENPGFTPILHDSKTLVPLRFVGEFFGADVSYDTQTRTGVVQVDGKTARFPIGGDYFVLDGERLSLDAEALNIDGRILLPLRALCEQVLGLSVDYRSGVIYIAETAVLDDDTVKEVKSKIGVYVKVSDPAALAEYLEQAANDRGKEAYYMTDEDSVATGGISGGLAAPVSPSEDLYEAESPSPDAGADAGAGTADWSSTNIQTAGVDEGDIIKTDGKYIYLNCYGAVKIIRADGDMSFAAQIEIPGGGLTDMYVDDGRLIVTGSEYSAAYRAMPEGGGPAGSYRSDFVFVNVYDTSDMTDIKLLRDYKIEGYPVTSRKQADCLYILSTQSIWSYGGGDPRPLTGENGKLEPMPIGDIMIAPGCPADSFLTLTAINIKDAGSKATSETITINGYGSTQYMSDSAMYIASTGYIYGGGDDLSIAKFSVNGDKIGYAGSGKLRGGLNDQFGMDEYRGRLRVVTSERDARSANNLFVLDENMRICGSVEGFAPDERIYSARFMGDRGYVVTFRETDPLFVFDLCDPENPAITGELKVPGFSSYLHPVSENVILGVGRDVYDIYMKDKNGNEIVVGQRTGGIKLSLFDVSDMGKPREIDTLILGDEGYAELLYNHKAAMFKADEKVTAFCADIADGAQRPDWQSGAFIISYAGNKLTERGRIAGAPNDGIGYGYSFAGQRLVYIGDTLYYAQNQVIRSFDLNTLAEKQSLRFV